MSTFTRPLSKYATITFSITLIDVYKNFREQTTVMAEKKLRRTQQNY